MNLLESCHSHHGLVLHRLFKVINQNGSGSVTNCNQRACCGNSGDLAMQGLFVINLEFNLARPHVSQVYYLIAC